MWKCYPTESRGGMARLLLQQMTNMQHCSKVLMHFSTMGRHHYYCVLWNHHPLNHECTHAYSPISFYFRSLFFFKTKTPVYTHPKCDGIYCLLHAPATAPCGVEDLTMHNCVALDHSWLCSQMQRSTPDHTQLRRWVWSAVRQTWTFQPVEVSAIILTPYIF